MTFDEGPDQREAERLAREFFRRCPHCGGEREELTEWSPKVIGKRRLKAAQSILDEGGTPLYCRSCLRISEQIVEIGDPSSGDE